MPQPFIKLEDVTFEYGKGRKALDSITLSIDRGEFVAVIGRNGSGKSTFARILNGLITPASGRVLIDGMDTSDYGNLQEIRRAIGVVFQNPDNQIVGATVEDDAAFGLENLGVKPKQIRETVNQSLKMVKLSEYAKFPPHFLSGGQKQKLAIAGVLAMAPECIVFDEATSMLDPASSRELLDLASRFNREGGVTIIYITHDMNQAARADRVIVLDEGKVVKDGRPDEVFLNSRLMKRAGLGMPQLLGLSAELEKRGFSIAPTMDADELLKNITSLKYIETETASAGRHSGGNTVSNREDIVRFDDVSHLYMPGTKFEKKALQGVNMKVRPGEFVAITGAAGSGKTTLIQHMNGLLFATAGNIVVDGKKVKKGTKLSDIRKKVGVVFQHPEDQLFARTVYEDIAFGPEKQGLQPETVRVLALNALRRVGLDDSILERSPFELSGGEKRRVAIAGVLAIDTEVVVLDEPTAGLDFEGKMTVVRLLSDIVLQDGRTVIVVSHDVEMLAEYADRIFVLKDGKIAAEGTPHEVLSKQGIEKAGISLLPVTDIMSKLKEMYPEVRDDIYTVEDAVNEIANHFIG